MTAEFSIEAEPDRNLIRIRMAGLFSLRDIALFAEARRRAHDKLRCARTEHVTLNDLRDLKIQPQEVVAAFGEMLAASDYRSRRLAFVVAPTLARSQLKRAVGDRDCRCFEDPQAAEAWLLEEDVERIPPRRAAR
jgi:hypothetical protein